MPPNTLTVTVPWTYLVSDNRKYLTGRFVLTPEYRRAKDGVLVAALRAAKAARWVCTSDPLALDVTVTMPDRRKRDLNFDKCVCDGLEESEAVMADDSQVVAKVWRFVPTPDKATAGAVVRLTRLVVDESANTYREAA